jgi:hypothetical protein
MKRSIFLHLQARDGAPLAAQIGDLVYGPVATAPGGTYRNASRAVAAASS